MVRVTYGSVKVEDSPSSSSSSSSSSRKIISSFAFLTICLTCVVFALALVNNIDSVDSSFELVGLGASEEDQNEIESNEAILKGGAEAPRNPDVDPKYYDLLKQAECEQEIEDARAKAFVTGAVPPVSLGCAPSNSTSETTAAAAPPAAAAADAPKAAAHPQKLAHLAKKK